MSVDKNNSRVKNFLIWLFVGISILFCISTVFVFIQLIEIDNLSFLNYLLSSAEDYIGLSFENVQNIYITVFTCFIGIYFTVLGIMMANLKVAFTDFFKFSFEAKSVVFAISIFFQFLEVVFIFPQMPYHVFEEIVLYIFIGFLIIFSIVSIIQMSVLQNYKKCLSLFVKKSRHGTEAAKLMLDFAHNKLGLHRVFLRLLADNISAYKAYRKAGFISEGIFRDMKRIDGKCKDIMFMSSIQNNGRGEYNSIVFFISQTSKKRLVA